MKTVKYIIELTDLKYNKTEKIFEDLEKALHFYINSKFSGKYIRVWFKEIKVNGNESPTPGLPKES